MVRRKIEIKLIKDASKRYTSFSKRRKGLFKKTMELCKKLDCEGAAIAITKAGNAFSTAHPHIDNVLSRYYADLSEEGTQENDVVNANYMSSSDVQLREAQEVVSEAMKTRLVVSALMNVGFAELDGLEKVFKSILADNVARRREAELNVESGHAD